MNPNPNNKVLDTSGLHCPYPLAKAKQALKKMPAGSVLTLISTDPASVIDFRVFTEISSEYSLLESYKDQDKFVFKIVKASS